MAVASTSLAAANTVGSFAVANSRAQYLDFSLSGSSTKRPVRIFAPVLTAACLGQSFAEFDSSKCLMRSALVAAMLSSLRTFGIS